MCSPGYNSFRGRRPGGHQPSAWRGRENVLRARWCTGCRDVTWEGAAGTTGSCCLLGRESALPVLPEQADPALYLAGLYKITQAFPLFALAAGRLQGKSVARPW